MILISSHSFLALFQMGVTAVSALAACLGALFYLGRVRLERPAIGTFNGRDIVLLFVFLVILPEFYLLLPEWALSGVLTLTFTATLSIGFRPVLTPAWLWLGIGVLIGGDLWMGQRLIDNVSHWHFVWAENSVVVLLVVISIANLYVQGGMQLRHMAWFAGGLAVYDTIVTLVLPVSNRLLREFVNHPLFPAMGMRIGFDEAIVGLGDLLVYAGFTLAAVKAYGRSGLRMALALVLVFGVVVPPLTGFLISYVDTGLDIVIPAQTWFGPAAVLGYLWLRRRYGRERTMKEYLDTAGVGRREEPAAALIPEQPKTESVTA